MNSRIESKQKRYKLETVHETAVHSLKYSQFQELTIRVLDEKGKPPHFLNKIFLVLHFRKKT